MKERLGIHFCITYIYVLLTRNLLASGKFYASFHTSFQKSLLYSLIIAIAITIILETWKMYLEKIDIKYLKYIILLTLITTIGIMFKLSIYYIVIVIYIAFHIIRDSINMLDMNGET